MTMVHAPVLGISQELQRFNWLKGGLLQLAASLAATVAVSSAAHSILRWLKCCLVQAAAMHCQWQLRLVKSIPTIC